MTVASSEYAPTSVVALSDLPEHVRTYSSVVIISDELVFPLYGTDIKAQIDVPVYHLVLPAGECSKTLEAAFYCWQQMQKIGLDRKSLVIGLGGGSMTDLAGFVAACFMRGIDVMHIPTTLLGMVDAAIGGKTAVNLPRGKNLIGAMHHPRCVFIAPHYLNTLPDRELVSGLVEVIKYGVVAGPELFLFLEEDLEKILERDHEMLCEIINRSCMIKAKIVEEERNEPGRRHVLNWGHTFAHAIEVATGYRKYSHGEAVAIGMRFAARMSEQLGYVDARFVERQDALFHRAGLSVHCLDIDPGALVDLMVQDKKSVAGKINLVLARGLGDLFLAQDVDRELIKQVLTY